VADYESQTKRKPLGGLDRFDYDDVVQALREWAGSHPRAEEPIFFEMGRAYSPAEFTNQVVEHTDIGLSFLEYIASQSKRTGVRPRTFVDRAILANRSF